MTAPTSSFTPKPLEARERRFVNEYLSIVGPPHQFLGPIAIFFGAPAGFFERITKVARREPGARNERRDHPCCQRPHPGLERGSQASAARWAGKEVGWLQAA